MLRDWSNKTILIAEDDEISYKYLYLILTRKTQANVLWAINGKMAIDFCRRYDFIDLVLMDLQLPVIGGLEALKQIKAIKPTLPVMVQTANAYGDECEKCFEAGCDEFVTKPVNFQDLIYKIGNLLSPVSTR